MNKPLRILHTSDWHLGRTLYGRRRYHEFAAFLEWLAQTIEENEVDALLLAGDVFDSPNPSARAQSLYYRFLGRIANAADCGHVVVIAGNHDSPSLLSAPGDILKALDIHVVGKVSEDGRDEVLILRDRDQSPQLIVAAVPYPRDRDLRDSAAGESAEDKERKLVEAVGGHYHRVGTLAEESRAAETGRPPMIAMGHLFAAGGRTVEGDGVRNLYIGSLGQMPAAIFPECFDYVALGHLHQPQMVAGLESIRYSGAPLAMSFSEAGRGKSVTMIDFQDGQMKITQLEVPVFQRLERVCGDWTAIRGALMKLVEAGAEAWVEVEYSGEEIMGDLRQRLADMTAGTSIDILRVRNNRIAAKALESADIEETLHGLDEEEVFRRCLSAHQVPMEQQAELISAYSELLKSISESGDE